MELENGLELRESNFPKNFTRIVYLIEKKKPWDTQDNIVFRLFKNFQEDENTYHINYWYELLNEKYLFLFYQCEKIIVPDNSYRILFPDDLENIIFCYNEKNPLSKEINQYFISNVIKHVELPFKNYLNIKENNYNENNPCYFFGVYNYNDLNNIKNHDGDKYVIFGGSDLDINMDHCRKIIPQLKKINNIKYYFISDNLLNRGKELGLIGELVELDLTENISINQNKDLNEIKKRNSIYCYTGCNSLGKLYNYELIKEIEKEIPQFNFIYSHELNCSHNEMKKIYEKCFIGIRLTRKDGNANTVMELNKLCIPVIFNGNNVNSINYIFDNKQDIIKKILNFKCLA